jgi:hypothetical protein
LKSDSAGSCIGGNVDALLLARLEAKCSVDADRAQGQLLNEPAITDAERDRLSGAIGLDDDV